MHHQATHAGATVRRSRSGSVFGYAAGMTWRRAVGTGLAVLALGVAGFAEVRHARANGEAEYVAPVDRPVSAIPGRPLPYAVAEEAAPRGVPSILLQPLPADFAYLTTSQLSKGVAYDNALGEKRHCLESIVLRGSELAQGKITIAAGSLGYVTESTAGALPFRQDALCIRGVPHTLVDFEQTIVTRKKVTIGLGEAALLGSELFRLRSITEFGDARSAVVEVSALSGFDWGRLGSGSLELSVTQPGWHAKTFHYGLHQGRVEQVTEKELRLGWLSGLRTDEVVLAEKREFAGQLAQGAETALGGGGRLRVLRLDPGARQIDLDTPDGKKTLSAGGDLRALPADSALRKRLIAVGSNYAFVLVPEASDFAARRAHVEVYSGLHRYRHGDVVPDARSYKAFAHAHYTGAVHGLTWVNDQPLELTPESPNLEGPARTFKLVTRWSKQGQLESFELEDGKGGRSAAVAAAGRKSLDFLAGAGPTIESILARAAAAPLAELSTALGKRQAEARSPAPASSAGSPPAARETASNPTSVALIRPALFWICAASVVGLLIGFGLGRAR